MKNKVYSKLFGSFRKKKEIFEWCLKNKRRPSHGKKCTGEKERKMFWRLRGYTNPKHPTYDYHFNLQISSLYLAKDRYRRNNKEIIIKPYLFSCFVLNSKDPVVEDIMGDFSYITDDVDDLIDKISTSIYSSNIKYSFKKVKIFINKYKVMPSMHSAKEIIESNFSSQKTSDYFDNTRYYRFVLLSEEYSEIIRDFYIKTCRNEPHFASSLQSFNKSLNSIDANYRYELN